MSYLDSLNPPQREAVLQTEGPLIVLAGAGSGKTKMLTARIAHLIRAHRVPPHQILAVTFTNKAAAEMRERVERFLNMGEGALKQLPVWQATVPSLGVPEIGTFHSVCLRILRRELHHTPFMKPFVVYDDADQLSLVKEAMTKMNIDTKSVSPKAIQGAINRLKCDAVEPHELDPASHELFGKQLKTVYTQYQKDLFLSGAIDFGEILTLTYRVLRDHADVRKHYQGRFRYIHVDEYQDTNRAQYLLLSTLADPKQGGHGNLCVVGDEDQSIYKWRGADIRNIMDFEHDYPGAHIVKLEQNYRSKALIIRAASQVISNNRSRKDKTLWTENEEGERVVRAQLADERAEAEMVVSEVKRLAATESRAFQDFAIFYRTNAQSRTFEDVLRREKIPYQIVGGLRFYDRKEIKDILSYFRVILNPSDGVSLKRIINVPARGIGKSTIERLEDALSPASGLGVATFFDALRLSVQDPDRLGLSAGTARKLGVFLRLIEKFQEKAPALLLSELYHLILDETGYVGDLKKEGSEESLARIENLEEFDNVLEEFEEDLYENAPPGSEGEVPKSQLLPIFLEQTALTGEADAKAKAEAYGTSLKLMTLHASKGLEFPVVFLVGMEEGLFPSVRAWEETPEEDIEEERRLCYVGITRAREKLYLTHAQIRRVWGNTTYQEPSRFFTEIPDDCIEIRDFSYGARAQSFRSGSSRQIYGTSQSVANGQFRGSGNTTDLVGRRIDHPEYGSGTITDAEGAGEAQKVIIDFRPPVGKRKFLYRYVASFLT